MTKCKNQTPYDCDNCQMPDCTFDGILTVEKQMIMQRDVNYFSSATVVKPKPVKASKRKGMSI